MTHDSPTSDLPPRGNGDLPKWLWLWFPPLIFVAHAITRSGDYLTYDYWMKGEFGYIELATFAFLAAAVCCGVTAMFYRGRVAERWFVAWVALLTLGCVYYAGEEISWGHHWGFHPFGEDITQSLIASNDQDEPNLHNQTGLIGSLLDQWPRFLLSMGALFGGVLVPLWVRWKRRPMTWPAAWVWPTIVCLPTSAFALTVTAVLPRHEDSFAGWGETKEYFLALFLLLYLASLLVRLRNGSIATATGLAPVHRVDGLSTEPPQPRSRANS